MARRFAQTLFSPAALCRFVLTATVGLALDLWTKSLAVEKLGPDAMHSVSRTYVLIRGWLQFEFILNPGAVFGIAPGKTMMFIIVSILAIAFLTYLFSTSAFRPFYQIILGLLLAGVLGNMYDRIFIGEVRDMIHALPGWHWPMFVRHATKLDELFPYIFNVADSLLCTGVALMLIYSFVSSNEQQVDKPRAKAVEA